LSAEIVDICCYQKRRDALFVVGSPIKREASFLQVDFWQCPRCKIYYIPELINEYKRENGCAKCVPTVEQ
jgi:hypothetical protein